MKKLVSLESACFKEKRAQPHLIEALISVLKLKKTQLSIFYVNCINTSVVSHLINSTSEMITISLVLYHAVLITLSLLYCQSNIISILMTYVFLFPEENL